MRWMQLAKVTALIPCAGQGNRMGGTVNKPYLEVYDRPLLAYTLDKFQSHSLVDEIILIAKSDEVEYCKQEIVHKYSFTKVSSVVVGGLERQDSVRSGLAAVDAETEWIIVHDGVRPLVTAETISRALNTAFVHQTAVVGVPVKDTIKIVHADLTVKETPDRTSLWQVQTPQVFRKDILLEAYKKAYLSGWRGTDDASLVEKYGRQVWMVRGEYSNIKVTTPEDLLYVKEMIRVDE